MSDIKAALDAKRFVDLFMRGALNAAPDGGEALLHAIVAAAFKEAKDIERGIRLVGPLLTVALTSAGLLTWHDFPGIQVHPAGHGETA